MSAENEPDWEMYERVWAEARRERQDYERQLWAWFAEIERRVNEAILADSRRILSDEKEPNR